MSWRNRRDYLRWMNRWNIVDDRSGFNTTSDKIMFDHHGYVTTRNNWDPKHPTEYPFPKIYDKPLRTKYMRTEGPDVFLDAPRPWEQIDINWEDIETNWEDE